MSIAAIETRYAGCRFRSRLEARWAVFFDALEIPWEYEPQGYELGSAGRYLPDFWLPRQRMFYEVKGAFPPPRDHDRYLAFAEAVWSDEITDARKAIMYVGDIPRPDTLESVFACYGLADDEGGFCEGDWPYFWCRCAWCGAYDVQFDGRSARAYCGCHAERGCHPSLGCGNGDKCYNAAEASILDAYGRARSARFEHREAA